MPGPQAVQQRAAEAEEDQQRAEQQALAAVAELRQLQLQHQQTWQPPDDSQQPSNLLAAPGPCLLSRKLPCLLYCKRSSVLKKVACMPFA